MCFFFVFMCGSYCLEVAVTIHRGENSQRWLSDHERQAPRWVQGAGMEWFFRMCCEPRRLARRYLVNNPLFLCRIAAQLSGLRKYPLE